MGRSCQELPLSASVLYGVAHCLKKKKKGFAIAVGCYVQVPQGKRIFVKAVKNLVEKNQSFPVVE